MKKSLFIVFSLALGFKAQAQDSTKSNVGTFSFSGYLDSYYFANLNNPASRSNLGAAGTARAFDQRAGQFSLGLVQTKINYVNDKSEAVVDLTFGPNSDLGNYGNVVGPLGEGTTSLAIKQAYFNYKATDKLTFTAGQFGTHIGYEVIDAPINYNYSLSNLFNNGPFYHIGLKANYAFSDKVALMAGVVNNVDNLNDNNRSKGIISQLFVSPAKGWNVYVNWIGSNEANPKLDAKEASGNFYNLLDLTTTYQVTDKFFVGLNAAYGTQKGSFQGADPGSDSALVTREWGGVAFYSNYAISDKFGLGIRLETFDNTGGSRGLLNANGEGTTVNSFTLTSNITLANGHLLLKPEVRLDMYKKLSGDAFKEAQQFEDKDGLFTKDSQITIGLAAVYKF